MSKVIGYARVSTEDQNPERQLEGLELDKKFVDYASAKCRKRPQLEAMLEYVRDGDMVVVHSMDRLARNLRHLREIVDELIAKDIKVKFIKENLEFTGADSAMSNLLLSLMGSFSEFEYAFIKERQREGIAAAKKRGAYKGRPRIKDTPDKIERIRELLRDTRMSKTRIAEEVGISRYTLYTYIKQYNLLDGQP